MFLLYYFQGRNSILFLRCLGFQIRMIVVVTFKDECFSFFSPFYYCFSLFLTSPYLYYLYIHFYIRLLCFTLSYFVFIVYGGTLCILHCIHICFLFPFLYLSRITNVKIRFHRVGVACWLA